MAARQPRAPWLEIEGTLAFVDISGFTAMSEKLSSHGKAGAEEVTDVMNATFAALLEVAYAEGGGLLKFGGDALLLFYDGEDHARRAARGRLRDADALLRAIGRPRTSRRRRHSCGCTPASTAAGSSSSSSASRTASCS